PWGSATPDVEQHEAGRRDGEEVHRRDQVSTIPQEVAQPPKAYTATNPAYDPVAAPVAARRRIASTGVRSKHRDFDRLAGAPGGTRTPDPQVRRAISDRQLPPRSREVRKLAIGAHHSDRVRSRRSPPRVPPPRSIEPAPPISERPPRE